MWRYCIQHQHVMSEYGFNKCEYSNITGNTVVSSTYCEHPLLGAANAWQLGHSQNFYFVYK